MNVRNLDSVYRLKYFNELTRSVHYLIISLLNLKWKNGMVTNLILIKTSHC